MDIAGAKALKERLGHEGEAAASSAAPADVPEHAPPVYHYLGIADSASETEARVSGDTSAESGRRSIRRLRLFFR